MTSLDATMTSLIAGIGTAAIKSTVVLCVAGLVVRLLQRRTAALRHLVWTLGLGAAVALVALPPVVPAWRIVPIHPFASNVRFSGGSAPLKVPAPAASSPTLERPSPSRSPAVSTSATPSPARTIPGETHRLPWAAVAFMVWSLGVLIVIARYAWSLVVLSRLARSSVGAGSDKLMQQLVRGLGIARRVRLTSSDDLELPITWGILHPRVVLPTAASEWSRECYSRVLLHELAHIRRVDAGTQLVAQAAAALFWFHPLVWYAVARMRCERERACDDIVLANGTNAAEYASDLLSLVTIHSYVQGHTVALAFARRSHFEGRLLALLDPAIDRRALSPARVLAAVTVSAAFVLPVAALESSTPRTAGPGARQSPSAVVATTRQSSRGLGGVPGTADSHRPAPAPASSQDAAATSVAGRAVAAAADPVEDLARQDDIFTGCESNAGHYDSDASHIGAGSIWTASGSRGGCSFTLSASGDIRFNRDVSTIAQLAPGATFSASANVRGDSTSLVVNSDASGQLRYDFSRNGQRVDFVPDGEAWFARYLLAVDRMIAFGVDSRFPLLLSAGGPGAVIDEVDQMRSDYAKSVYLQRLMRSTTLDPVQVRRVVAAAGTMTHAHSADEVLLTITGEYRLTDSTTSDAALRAALRLDSDHERVDVECRLVESATLSHADLASILGSAPRLNADYEKMRLLLAIAHAGLVDASLRDAYSQVAESIHDIHQRDRVLTAVRRP